MTIFVSKSELFIFPSRVVKQRWKTWAGCWFTALSKTTFAFFRLCGYVDVFADEGLPPIRRNKVLTLLNVYLEHEFFFRQQRIASAIARLSY